MIQTSLFGVLVLISQCPLATGGFLQEFQTQTDRSRDASALPALPLSTKVSDVMRGTFFRTVRTSVRWRDKDYDIDAGIKVLMDVISDNVSSKLMRRTAINTLGHFSTGLQGRQCLGTLRTLYDDLETHGEKKEVLRCLLATQDPIALGLFYRIVATEPDPVLRFSAAVGLAAWNIRAGVQQLIELFSSTADAGLRDVGAAAMISFSNLNERKEWDCPQDELRKSALDATDRSGDKYAKTLLREYREWFAANEHRFPNWKPGDPLPEIPERKTEKSDR